jgi:hypothetical protein
MARIKTLTIDFLLRTIFVLLLAAITTYAQPSGKIFLARKKMVLPFSGKTTPNSIET